MGVQKLPIRTVGLRDGLVMLGDHSTVNRRHWRATAAAFALIDPRGTPMLWVEGASANTQVVGELALTVAKPRYGGRRSPGLAKPGETASLKFFEVVRVGGVPVIRTWWAIGEALDRTSRTAFDEVLPSARAERDHRFAELFALMGV